MNQKLERKLVLEPCLKLCKQLLGTHILQYRRLDALDTYHVSGSPDIEIWVPREKLIHIIMAEAKKPNGGVFSKSQISYKEKYEVYFNVTYAGIMDVKELKKLILSISDYGCKSLEEFLRS